MEMEKDIFLKGEEKFYNISISYRKEFLTVKVEGHEYNLSFHHLVDLDKNIRRFASIKEIHCFTMGCIETNKIQITEENSEENVPYLVLKLSCINIPLKGPWILN